MTYDLIQEQVLSSAAASVTFSNIPQGFKDLVLEIVGSLSAAQAIVAQFNGDTGSNYSLTQITGDGSTAASGRSSNQTYVVIGDFNTALSMSTTNIQSYSNTNVFKTALTRASSVNSGDRVMARVHLWRSTSAITSILIYGFASTNLSVNSTFRLWGVAG